MSHCERRHDPQAGDPFEAGSQPLRPHESSPTESWVAFLDARRTEAHRHAARPVDEPGVEALSGSVRLEVVNVVEQLVEHAADLEPREARAEAEVRAAAAECDVRIRIAADVEAIGIR